MYMVHTSVSVLISGGLGLQGMGRYIGCHDIKGSVNFLGHIVDANKIQKGEHYIEAEVRQFWE